MGRASGSRGNAVAYGRVIVGSGSERRPTVPDRVRLAGALLLSGAWGWAVLRAATESAQAGPVEGALLAGGWGLSLLPVHCVPAGRRRHGGERRPGSGWWPGRARHGARGLTTRGTGVVWVRPAARAARGTDVVVSARLAAPEPVREGGGGARAGGGRGGGGGGARGG